MDAIILSRGGGKSEWKGRQCEINVYTHSRTGHL